MENAISIKEKFNKLGFDLIGFSKPELEQKVSKNFKNRYKNNDLPPFLHPNIEGILDPKKEARWVKSIIVVGLSYASSSNQSTDGFISRYSRGNDYHQVMKRKIKKGIKVLNKLYDNLKYSYYVDNGPVLEKALAQQAGLGWIGKNTLLINEKYGSYIFLGEIFINKELPFDKPADNKCGSCNLCRKNCPTDSLQTPYYLNYRTCRSNLTQLKGILNEEEEKLIGNCIWGCDNCQVACPFNKEIPKDLHPEFASKIRGDITEILNYRRKNFPKKWLNTALSWRGMRVIQRNALISLNNLGLKKTEYRDLVMKKMKDNSPILRYYAYKTYLSLGFDINLIKDIIKSENEVNLEKILKGSD
ncbi:MAG: tRNA epoxyqueuosine(34) reductase QueG [Halanaerobiales bacterium]